jgi:uncharacterized integral membrane protein
MKNLKLIFILVVLILLAALGLQNRDFLMTTRSVTFNIYFYSYTSPEMPIGLFFIAAFLSGTLVTFFFNLMTQFKKTITIKSLINDGKNQEKKIQLLENEIKELKEGNSN